MQLDTYSPNRFFKLENTLFGRCPMEFMPKCLSQITKVNNRNVLSKLFMVPRSTIKEFLMSLRQPLRRIPDTQNFQFHRRAPKVVAQDRGSFPETQNDPRGFSYLYYYMRNYCNLIGGIAVVFKLYLKYLHVKITNLLLVVV